MWDTPFDESMLQRNTIIYCPNESLFDELMETLERNGITWYGDEPPTSDSRWDEHREETCYWVEGRYLSYGNRDWAEEDPDEEYQNHIKCTYTGDNTPDFETATDAELMSFLGIGGGK